MKNGEDLKRALIGNTIRLIGECGFEKATTKAISFDNIDLGEISPNEVYIYRLFGSKTKLYEVAFFELEEELFFCVRSVFKNFFMREGTFEEKFHTAFLELWRFLLGNEVRCRCYVRFYYSSYFKGDVLRQHRSLLKTHSVFFEPAFREESNILALIHTTFMTMLDFAISVYNKDLEDNEDTSYHTFLLLFGSLKPYIKSELLNE